MKFTQAISEATWSRSKPLTAKQLIVHWSSVNYWIEEGKLAFKEMCYRTFSEVIHPSANEGFKMNCKDDYWDMISATVSDMFASLQTVAFKDYKNRVLKERGANKWQDFIIIVERDICYWEDFASCLAFIETPFVYTMKETVCWYYLWIRVYTTKRRWRITVQAWIIEYSRNAKYNSKILVWNNNLEHNL